MPHSSSWTQLLVSSPILQLPSSTSPPPLPLLHLHPLCPSSWRVKHLLPFLALQVDAIKQRHYSHNEDRNSLIQRLLVSLMSLPQRAVFPSRLKVFQILNSLSFRGTDMASLVNKETQRILYVCMHTLCVTCRSQNWELRIRKGTVHHK